MPKPRVIDPGDVIVKVTGSTICGSDLHLYHGECSVPIDALRSTTLTLSVGVIPQLEKGDVLGHECCGVVDSVGPEATKVKTGDRVVVSFPIACGHCKNCNRQLYSQCENTNQNTISNVMYGNRTAGKLTQRKGFFNVSAYDNQAYLDTPISQAALPAAKQNTFACPMETSICFQSRMGCQTRKHSTYQM